MVIKQGSGPIFFFYFTFSPPNANCFFSPVFAFFSLLHRLITPLPSPFLLLFQSLPSIPSSSPLLFRHHHQHFNSSSSWLLLSLSQLIHHLHHQRFPPPASVLLLRIDAISSLIISSPSLLLWISVWLSLLCYRCCCLLLPLAVSIFIDCCWWALVSSSLHHSSVSLLSLCLTLPMLLLSWPRTPSAPPVPPTAATIIIRSSHSPENPLPQPASSQLQWVPNLLPDGLTASTPPLCFFSIVITIILTVALFFAINQQPHLLLWQSALVAISAALSCCCYCFEWWSVKFLLPISGQSSYSGRSVVVVSFC